MTPQRLRRPLAALVAVAALLAVPAHALAVTDAQLQNLDSASDTGGATGLSGGSATTGARVFIGLALVLGLVYVAHRVLRRIQRGRLGAIGSDGAIEVLSTTALGANRVLHLVRVGDQVLLLGATDGAIATLHELAADDPMVAALLEPGETAGSQVPSAPRTLRVADALRDLTAR